MTIPLFSDEVQLAGWSDSHTGGAKVTLWLADPAQLDVFRTLTMRKGNTAGHRLACVLVEIGDDEKLVEPEPTPERKKLPSERLSFLAVRFCKEPLFWEWLETDPDNACHSEGGAILCVNAICEIESRAELDTSMSAAHQFHELIRKPYAAWLKSRNS